VRVNVIGAGGVGGYFGGRLAAAGVAVGFFARGRHLEALRRDGLTILSPELSDTRLPSVEASDRPQDLPPADLVVVAVKNWDTDEAGRAAAKLRAPGGEVVSFQNGVEAWERLERIVGTPVLGGVARVAAIIERPGVIRQTGVTRSLTLGDFGGRRPEVLERFREVGERAGFEVVLSDDIRAAIWEKFLFLTSMSGIAAATRLPAGAVRTNPATRGLLERAMCEVEALARASGVDLPEDVVPQQMAFADRISPASTPSMLGDLRRGSRLELPWLSGAVAKMGRERGVPTPIHGFAAAILDPYKDGPPAAD
jgi:2-dehydropantoate 2-reductase